MVRFYSSNSAVRILSRIRLRAQPLESSLGRVPQATDGTGKKIRKLERVGRRGLSEPREDFSRLPTNLCSIPWLDSEARFRGSIPRLDSEAGLCLVQPKAELFLVQPKAELGFSSAQG